MRRISALVASAVLLAGCGDANLAPFGQLRGPVALAVHQPSASVFIASLGGDELRVFDARNEAFLTAPAALFPLSIPTVTNPTQLSAADRFVFVLSSPSAELAFVDTVVRSGGVGPRSVDVGGFPLTLPLDMVPTALTAFSAAWPWDAEGTLADHAIVAGLDGAGTGGVLLVARPPVVDGEEIVELPLPESVLELPGVFPSAVALDSTPAAVAGLRGPGGAPVVDCRPLAIADGRPAAADHTPAIWLTRVRVQADGALTVDPLDPAQRVEIRVPLQLADGSVEERPAPVRELAFVPAPLPDAALTAIAADPCALRSGRIYAALDPSYCTGASVCPDVAVVDLAGPSGPGLAPDALVGGPALYDFPGAALRIVALSGPFDLPGAVAPFAVNDAGVNPPLDAVPALGMVASSNGSIYYLDGGLGPYLVGPTAADRAPVSASFPADGEQAPPGLVGDLARTDPGLPGTSATIPSIGFPPGARPLDERWTLAFQRALPGFDSLGRAEQVLADGTLEAPQGASFVAPLLVQADPDPRRADRLVPRAAAGVICEGFPVVAVEAGLLRVDLQALSNPEGCLDGTLPLQLLPPLDEPWWIESRTSGFLGRLPAGAEASSVFVGDRLQFTFTPPAEDPVAGATFAFSTTDGFRFFGAGPGNFGELPAAVAPFLAAGPRAGTDPDWRVFIAYSGTDTLARLFPTSPDAMEFFQ